RWLPMLAILFLVSVAARPICREERPGACATPSERHTAVGARGATDTLGRGAWLIDEENDEVLLAGPLGVLRRVKVGAWPEQLVVESSGRVFVACRQAGRVDVIGEDFSVRS